MSGPDGYDRLDDLFEATGESRPDHRALLVLGVGALSLALISAAFFMGRGVAGSTQEASSQQPSASQSQEGSARPSAPSRSSGREAPGTAPDGRLVGDPFAGPLRPAAVRGASAGCRAEPGVDSGGNRVGYGPGNLLDGAPSTAWRCPGDGRGVTLTLRLNRPQRVASVGLIPGYAKTDPFSGADRYAENRRISRVRWSFDSGAWAEQTFDTRRANRALQMMRIPPVWTSTVRVTIRDSVPGRRNTVAVSGVRVAAPRR